jgi:tripartite-type tricarboxylate transporter receptor subunit TctC
MFKRRLALKALALEALSGIGVPAIFALPGGPAFAQSFPAKAVRIVTPFPAGAGPDAALRIISDRLAKKWQRPVVVDNRPGGNGFIAVAAFKQGSTDGYDLIALDSSHITTHPLIFTKLPYNVTADFAPLSMFLRSLFFVTAAADSPYRSLDDIVAAAKASPGKINYGSWFIGSPGHLGGLRLQAMTDTQMTHVPYRDFGQLYTAVANKELDWALGSAASAGNMERSGRIRFVAFAAAQRDKLYPNVPCTAESPTLRGFEVKGWVGLFAPQSAPLDVRRKIAGDVAEVLKSPEPAERYADLRYEAPDLTPEAFADVIKRETEAWAGVVQTAHLRLD